MIRQKCQPTASKELREFWRWAVANHKIQATTATEADKFLTAYTASVEADMLALETRLEALRTQVGIEVFALDDRMLERALQLRAEVATLKPFDEAILAAVLVKASVLKASGATDLWFCDLDGDLVPVDKKGRPRKELAGLYAAAGITVRHDFQVP